MINLSDNKSESALPVELLEVEPEPTGTRVLEDEYGDPLIAGTYAVQEQPNADVLYPGRKTEAESEQSDGEVDSCDENEKPPIRWQSFLLPCFLLFCGLGITLTFVLQQSKVKQNVQIKELPGVRVSETPATRSTAILSFDAAINKALASYRGDDLSFQQALALAKTRDEGMKLISVADELLRKGNARAAELIYRRALSVLGLSAGPSSWEYQLVLSRLSFIFQSKNRLQEQQEINEYSKRLQGS